MAQQGMTAEQLDAIDQAHTGGQGMTAEQLDAIDRAHQPSAPEPDLSKVNAQVKANLQAHADAQTAAAQPAEGGKPQVPDNVDPQAKEAKTFFDQLEAGWEMSVQGLVDRKKLPTSFVDEEHADWTARAAYHAGMAAGDLKAMLLGGAMGAGAGAETGPGAIITGAGGAFMVPALMRKALVDEYKKGSVRDFGDFFTRFTADTWESMKAAATGVATETAGIAAKGIPMIGGMLTSEMAKLAAMTSVGKALEGQVPKVQDFIDNAVQLAGFHGVSTAIGIGTNQVASKLADIWGETGLHPNDVSTKAANDPVTKQDILSNNVTVPKSLDSNAKPEGTNIADPDMKHPVLAGDPNMQEQGVNVTKPAEEKPAGGSLENVKAKGEGVEEVEPHPLDKQIVWGNNEGKPAETTFQGLFRRVFDKLDPVAQAENALTGGNRKNLKAINSPYWLMRNLDAANAKAHAAVTGEGIRDINGNPLGLPSLEDAVKPHEDDRVGFTRFMVAASAVEREGSPIPVRDKNGKPVLDEDGNPKTTPYKSGFKIEGEGGAREVFEQGKKQYGEAAQTVTKIMNASLDKLVDAGVVPLKSAEAAKAKWKYYTPQQSAESGSSGSGGGRSAEFTGLSKGRAAGAKILDPIEQAAQAIYARERMVAYNQAANAMGELARSGNSEAVKSVFKEVEAEGPEKITEAEVNDPNLVDKLSPVNKGEITYFKNGKRTTLVMPEEVAKAFEGTPGNKENLAEQAMRPFATMERAGAINSFVFMTRHLTRAEPQAFVFSQHPTIPGTQYVGVNYMPVIGFMHGMFHQLFKTEAFQNAEYDGALRTTVQSLHDDYLANDFFKLRAKDGSLSTGFNILQTPAAVAKAALDFMAKGVHMVAAAPSMSEYASAMRGKENTPENRMEAVKAARQIVPDASRMGSDAAVQFFSRVTPFWNVRMQGNLQLAEGLKNNTMATLLRGGAAVTIPALLAWAANRNDEDVKNANKTMKDLYYLIPHDNWQPATDIQSRMYPDHLLRQAADGSLEANNKVIYKIPKPFEMGIMFGALPERMLDYMVKKDPRAFDGFGRTLFEALKIDAMPAALQPVAEQFSNESLLTGAPIVPDHLQGYLARAQQADYTSELGKQIGSLLTKIPGMEELRLNRNKFASPMVIDNYIRDWGGGVGQFVSHLVDQAAGKGEGKAEGTAADTLYTGSFVLRYPNMNAEPIRQFFKRSAENKEWIDTYQYLLKNADSVNGLSTMLEAFDNGRFSSLKGIDTVESRLNKIVHELPMIPDEKMSPHDKRQLTDGLMYQAIRIAEDGNKTFDAFEAKVKEMGPQLEQMRKQVEEIKARGDTQRAPQSQPPQGAAPAAQPAQQPQQQAAPPSPPRHAKGGPQPEQRAADQINTSLDQAVHLGE